MEFDDLIAQQAELRALARRLLRDDELADDVVQDVFLDAVERGEADAANPAPPRESGARRLANLARGRRRTDSRRRRRERSRARSEEQPSALDAVLAEECRRELVRAVLGLREPYRTVVVLRFFDGLSTKEVADRTGAGQEAVKKQLQRACAQLRERLDSSMGPKRPWAILALPGALRDGAAPSTVQGKALGLLAVVAILGTVAAVRWRVFERSPGPAPLDLASLAGSEGQGRADTVGPVADTAAARVPDNAGESMTALPNAGAPDGPDAPSPAAPTFRARVVDAQGRVPDAATLAALRFEFRRSAAALDAGVSAAVVPLSADADGWLESDSIPRSPLLRDGRLVETTGERAVLAIGFEQEGDPDARVVVLPAVRIAGTVERADGTPAAGELVSISADIDTLGSYPGGLRTDTAAGPAPVLTDERGRFDLGAVPYHPRFSLYAGRPDTGGVRVALPGDGRDDLRLRLDVPPLPSGSRVTGRVVTPDGRAIAGATVRLGWLDCATDADGGFVIESSAATLHHVAANGHGLTATAPSGRFGHGPFDESATSGIVLVVPDALPRLEGRLVDAAGAALPGVHVSLLDGTPLGSSARSLENGGEAVRTADDGRFVLENLEPRTYDLRFVREEPFLVHDARGVLPGAGEVRVQVPQGSTAEGVRGRVVDLDGEPLAGVSVRPIAFPTARDAYQPAYEGPSVQTAADGTFEILHLPRNGAFLDFDARPNDGRRGVLLGVEDLAMDGAEPVVLDLDCEFTPTLREGPIGATLRFLDGAGAPVSVTRVVPGGIRIEPIVLQADDGGFGLLLVPSRVARVEVRDGDGVVLRVSDVDLSPVRPTEAEL